MQIHTQGVSPQEPRVFLIGLGLLELYYRAKGMDRRVDVTLPLPSTVRPLHKAPGKIALALALNLTPRQHPNPNQHRNPIPEPNTNPTP